MHLLRFIFVLFLLLGTARTSWGKLHYDEAAETGSENTAANDTSESEPNSTPDPDPQKAADEKKAEEERLSKVRLKSTEELERYLKEINGLTGVRLKSESDTTQETQKTQLTKDVEAVLEARRRDFEAAIKTIKDPKATEKDVQGVLDKLSPLEKQEFASLLKKDPTLPTTDALTKAKSELKIESEESKNPYAQPLSLREIGKPYYKSPLDERAPIPLKLPDLILWGADGVGTGLPNLSSVPATSDASVPLTLSSSRIPGQSGIGTPSRSEEETLADFRRAMADFSYELNQPKHLLPDGRWASEADRMFARDEQRKRDEAESNQAFANMMVGGAKKISQGFNPYAVQEYDYLAGSVHEWAGKYFKPGSDLITLGVNPKLAGVADIPGNLIELVPSTVIMLGNPDGASVRVGEAIEKERDKANLVPGAVAYPAAAIRVLTGTGDLQNGIRGVDTDGTPLSAEEQKDKIAAGGTGTLLTLAPLKGFVKARVGEVTGWFKGEAPPSAPASGVGTIGAADAPKGAPLSAERMAGLHNRLGKFVSEETLNETARVVKVLEDVRTSNLKPGESVTVSAAEETIIAKRVPEIQEWLRERPGATHLDAVEALNASGLLLSGYNSVNKLSRVSGAGADSLHVVASNLYDALDFHVKADVLKGMSPAERRAAIATEFDKLYKVDATYPNQSAVRSRVIDAVADTMKVSGPIPFERFRSIPLENNKGLTIGDAQAFVNSKLNRGSLSTATTAPDAARFQIPAAGEPAGNMAIIRYPRGTEGFVVNGEGVVAEAAKTLREILPNGRPESFVPNEMMVTRPKNGWEVESVRYEKINGQEVPVITVRPKN